MSDTYTLWIEEKAFGPVLKERIPLMLSARQITPETLCSNDGGTTWIPVSALLVATPSIQPVAMQPKFPTEHSASRPFNFSSVPFAFLIVGLLMAAVAVTSGIAIYTILLYQNPEILERYGLRFKSEKEKDYEMVKAAVKAKLYSPSSASFCTMDEMTLGHDGMYHGWVDSQNSSGTVVRTKFRCANPNIVFLEEQ